MQKERDVTKDWEFWKHILQRPDGSIDVEQLKKELSDFSMLMENVGELYCLLSGNKASKVMILPQVIASLHEEEVQAAYQEGYEARKQEESKVEVGKLHWKGRVKWNSHINELVEIVFPDNVERKDKDCADWFNFIGKSGVLEFKED